MFPIPEEWYGDLFLPGLTRANKSSVGPPIWGVCVLRVSFEPQDLSAVARA